MAIIGNKKKDIKIDEILSQISEYDIFRKVLGIDFKVNEIFCNPIRNEKNASTIIRNINNKLSLRDYGDSNYNGDCFHLVEFINNCNFYEALELIYRDFNLSSSLDIKKIITWKQPIIEKKDPPFFQIITRKPSREELKYWEDYHQGLDDLKRENIYFPKEIYRNRKKIPITIMTFCYYYPDVEKWKIYRPHGKLGKKVWYNERKWDSNLSFNYLENLKSFENCNKAFLATSKKDKMMVRKALEIESIGNIQGENIASINDVDMEYIKDNSIEQYCLGDSDEAGKKFSWLLTKNFNFKHVNTPDNLLPEVKDWADYGKEFGLETIKQYFKTKNIIE